MAGQKNTPTESLTLLSINTALKESYHSLSKHVRVPYKFLKPEDLKLVPLSGLLSLLIKEGKHTAYHGHGIVIQSGRVSICDELFGEYFGLPTHLFASTIQRRSLLGRYIASLLLADSLNLSGFSGSNRKKRKAAFGVMHAASREHYRHFAHSNFVRDMRKTIAQECGRISSDFRELGITDLDLLYALEKKPESADEKARMLGDEAAEADMLIWMIDKRRKTPLSEKRKLQLAIYKGFLKKTSAALRKTAARRRHWDPGKKYAPNKKTPYWKSLETMAAQETIPVKNIRSILEQLQPYKERILRSII